MTDDAPNHPALLPAGLRDVLPPDAEIEAGAVESVMAAFSAHGYQRVKPPLLEFEESLLQGAGEAVAEQMFRLMDPVSQRMMGVRADTTPQVARIAATRLASAPRPLRLSYAGQCLRVRGSQLAPDRQIAQAGIELIGADTPEADAEIIAVGAEALSTVGLNAISVDLTMPPLIPALIDSEITDLTTRQALARALDRKDAASVARHGGALARMLTELLLAAGPAERALKALADAPLPQAVRAHADRLVDTVVAVRRRLPTLRLTVDPVEFRGFRYHTGVALTVYAPGRNEELGRGGRYVSNEGAPATGLTLFPDAILRATSPRPVRPRCFVPFGVDASTQRAAGFATVAALEPTTDPLAEAKRLGCSHILKDGTAVPLE